ncbi:MAG: exodeoxyribonuclease V subunit gamma [Balneolaceae bacterium]
MIRIRTSDQLMNLADELSERIYRDSPPDPLVPVTVIVPNRETSRWLALHISEREGIAANLKWMLPSEWMWEMVRILHPDLPKTLPSDAGPMRWSIHDLLGDRSVAEQFPELNRYLRAGREEGSELRRWSLAGEMASLFDQYLVYRPWMIRGWEEGKPVRFGRVEEWQKKLWKILSEKWKTLGGNEKHLDRTSLYEELYREMKAGNEELMEEGMLHIFNPGLLSRPALDLASTLQTQRDITIYLVSSCSAGISSDSRSGIVNSMGGEQAETLELIRECIPEAEYMPVKSKSRNRGHQAGAGAHEDDVERGGTEACLRQIQKSIRMNTPFPVLSRLDDSVDIRSCHSTLREVEVLYDRLQVLFSKDSPLPGLTPDEVLVVTPDLERYAPYIEALFGTDEEGRASLPFHLPGRFRESSRKAPFQHLLQMPGSRFTFSEVMEFVQHRAVADQFRFSESDIRQLQDWFRENRVWWGLSGQHRAEFRQPPEEIHTWSSAFRRGWFGQVAGGEPGGFLNETLLYPGITGREEQELWARFHYLMRQLKQVVREASEEKSCHEWVEILQAWMNRFLSESGIQGGVPDPVASVLEQLGRESAAAGTEAKIPFSVIRNYLQSAFEESSTGSARFTRGIVFSSMVPVRSIPFRVIALLGLNDDLFPRKPVKPEFDLIARNPERGERDRKREDRNLFLESIMAAGDLHYCSYIGRSQKDDEPIPPSPILAEWIDLLRESRPGDRQDEKDKPLDDRPEVVIQERLNGFSEAYFLTPGEDSENPSRHARPGRGISETWYNVAAALQRQSGVSGLSVSSAVPMDKETVNRLEVSQLEIFYKHSIAYFLRHKLGISSMESSPESNEFALGILEKHSLFQRMFGWHLDGVSREKIRSMVAASGRLPSGYPGKLILDEISDATTLATAEVAGRFGSASRDTYNIDLKLDGVRIRGEIISWAEGEAVFVAPSRCSGKYLLPFWVDHLLVSMSLPQPQESWCLFGVRDQKPEWRRFRPAENPEEQLQTVLKLFYEGLTQPLPIFPKTAFVYFDTLARKEDPERAYRDAVTAWEGGYQRFGEREDDFYRVLYGEEAELDEELLEALLRTSRPILEPLIDHLEEPE